MYRRIFIATVLATAAFLVAHIVNLMVAHALTRSITLRQMSAKMESPPAPKVDSRKLTEEILASGIFGGPEAEAAPASLHPKGASAMSEAEALVSIGPPIDAAKKVKLVGTVVGDDKVDLAVVEEISTKKQTLYHLHDLIVNVGQITQIRKDAILIRQGAQHETLELDYAVSPVQPGTQVVIPTTPSAQ